jgi:fatty-acyl-CoA synthase
MAELTALENNLLHRANIGDMPRRVAMRYPDKPALICLDEEISFREFNNRCCRMAHALLELGVERGDRVAFMTHNCLQYLYSWMALAKIGGVSTPLNFMLKGPEIEYIINHAEPRVFFVEDILVPTVLEIAPRLESVERFGVIPVTAGGDVPDGWLDVGELLEASRDTSEPLVEVDDEDVATLIYTSGTEALPKGVMLTHRNHFSTLTSAPADLNVRKEDVVLLSIPLYHAAAKYLFLTAINMGFTMIFEYAPNPIEILELTQKHRVTYWVYPPTLYQILPSMPDFDKYDLSSLEKCIAFGAYMPAALLRQWKDILPQAEWRNYYGQTESFCLGSTLQPEDFEKKIVSIGTPHVGTEIKIFDDSDNEVPAGETGEIVMRGSYVMKGYFRDEEKTAETLRGGWLHTADLGRFDEDGILYFVDRKKDMIKSGGENVSSLDVEGIIVKHEKVMQAAVMGMPHEYWGEAVTAVVVPYPGGDVTEQEIVDYCEENMASYKVPKKVIVMAEVPTSPSGKILKRLLRDQLAEEIEW